MDTTTAGTMLIGDDIGVEKSDCLLAFQRNLAPGVPAMNYFRLTRFSSSAICRLHSLWASA